MNHQHKKFNEIIRLLFFVALETAIIENILVWGRRKGEVVPREKKLGDNVTDMEYGRWKNFVKKLVSLFIILTRSGLVIK